MPKEQENMVEPWSKFDSDGGGKYETSEYK